MYRVRHVSVPASEVAEYLNLDLVGEDVMLDGPHAVYLAGDSSRVGPAARPDHPVLAIADVPDAVPPGVPYILSPNPSRDLAMILLEFFTTASDEGIHPTAVVSPTARLGRSLRVGPGAIIGDDVEIGDGTWILGRAIIHGPATIGRHAVIKDGAVVGSEGYGFVQMEEGRLIHVPQVGRVVIGDRVWIGANSTVERAMLADTVIEDEVKIDDLVHIGQACRIGRSSMITAGCVLAYAVTLGAAVRLGPNASVRENLTIVAGAIVGQGAVVVADVLVPGTYVGVPAHLQPPKE